MPPGRIRSAAGEPWRLRRGGATGDVARRFVSGPGSSVPPWSDGLVNQHPTYALPTTPGGGRGRSLPSRPRGGRPGRAAPLPSTDDASGDYRHQGGGGPIRTELPREVQCPAHEPATHAMTLERIGDRERDLRTRWPSGWTDAWATMAPSRVADPSRTATMPGSPASLAMKPGSGIDPLKNRRRRDSAVSRA